MRPDVSRTTVAPSLTITIHAVGEHVAQWLISEFPVRDENNIVRVNGGSILLHKLRRRSMSKSAFRLQADVDWLPDLAYSRDGQEPGNIPQAPVVFGFRQLDLERVALTVTYPQMGPIESLVARLLSGMAEQWPEIAGHIPANLRDVRHSELRTV
jgi:hypothetical protein